MTEIFEQIWLNELNRAIAESEIGPFEDIPSNADDSFWLAACMYLSYRREGFETYEPPIWF